MRSTNFTSLSDIVLLEIFEYLSCEDVLYAFGDLHNFRFINLLEEHGAFEHICLSSEMSRRQYKILSNGIWRYELVRSFVCKEMFCEFIIEFTPCRIFPLLSELRILCIRCMTDHVEQFVIEHSSTLTHLFITRSEQSYIPENYEKFFYTVLPHLNQLKLLDTDSRSYVSIQWNQLTDCLQSLEHLLTYVENMSDVYTMPIDGLFPHLRSLRIYVKYAIIKTVSIEDLNIKRFHMAKLEKFDLYIKGRRNTKEDEKQVEWTDLERLICNSVMPSLREFSFIYTLLTIVDIQHLFQSSIFQNHERHIRVRFALHINAKTSINLSDITNICHDKILFQYNNEDESKLPCMWFTSSWPSWTIFSMNRYDIVPHNGVRHLLIKDPNISLHSISKLLNHAKTLICQYPGSFSINDSLLSSIQLINLHHITINDYVPGLEYLLDGIMVPRLKSINGYIMSLFISLIRRTNQMKTLDTVNHLVITDQSIRDERCFSFKQWYIVLDAFPRLKTFLIQFHNHICPPITMADLFINYIKRTSQTSLNFFSCCIDHCYNMESKEHFITYLEDKIEILCSPVQLASISPTRLDAWM
ncbi:unnamed protein product [Rotaria sp. Silwood2]|nr:unnamed protein product [Rotaria sp. Silwood2]CAF4559342.1 unnamed protein product [Rotaria sp. Silwood2]